MNRRERRAALARSKITAGAAPTDFAGLMTEASLARQQGRSAQAELICKQILARNPAHKTALNLLGVINQESGRHRLAIKMFSKALALDDLDSACHYNIASSYQVLGERADAAVHFKKAIALGMSGEKGVEEFVMQNRMVVDCVRRMTGSSVQDPELFSIRDIAAIASDIFIRCALQLVTLRGATLEILLTHFRLTLLRLAKTEIFDFAKIDDDWLAFFCALAEQCFNNEYVFAQNDEESRQAEQLRQLLAQNLSPAAEISPLLVSAVAAYFPLHALPGAEALLAFQWPQCIAELLRQQVREPQEEADDREAIPALTTIDDDTSKLVRQQYEKRPYPRWTVNQFAVFAAEMRRREEAAGGRRAHPGEEILIAGCGTGHHAFVIAQAFPDASVLAVDMSRTSLAYARRKTREEGLRNIAYAQADILNLATIGRGFDRIEAMGVLHHLADPMAGWRILLSLLKPNGIMRVGLYSETARRSIFESYSFIAESGYRSTIEDIRTLRQTIIRNMDVPRWKTIIKFDDFYSMSGCHDMFFNVMEHRFTIPQITAFLKEHSLSFLGFELESAMIEKFQQEYPGPEALLDLNHWNDFEAANPQTFRNMYVFSVCRNEHASQ